MALSDREKAIFDNLINGLEEEITEPVTQDVAQHHTRWFVLSIVGIILGIGLLITGVIVKLIFLGVLGFAIMLFSAWKFSTLWKL